MYYTTQDATQAKELLDKALQLLSAASLLIEEPGIVIRDGSPEDYIGRALEWAWKAHNQINKETHETNTAKA